MSSENKKPVAEKVDLTPDLSGEISQSVRPIRAILRGLDTLVALNMKNGASVTDLARTTGIPRTTVYRILETLASAGFVSRDSKQERYRLTILVRTLSDGFDDEEWLTQIAAPILKDYAEKVIWPVSLATINGNQMLVRETTDHDSPLALERFSAGFRVPILSSASGRVCLAFSAEEKRKAILDVLSKSDDKDDNMVHQESLVEQILTEVKKAGFAVFERPLSNEITFAVPILVNGEQMGAVTMRFIRSAIRFSEIVSKFYEPLKSCCDQIAAELEKERTRSGF